MTTIYVAIKDWNPTPIIKLQTLAVKDKQSSSSNSALPPETPSPTKSTTLHLFSYRYTTSDKLKDVTLEDNWKALICQNLQ